MPSIIIDYKQMIMIPFHYSREFSEKLDDQSFLSYLFKISLGSLKTATILVQSLHAIFPCLFCYMHYIIKCV